MQAPTLLAIGPTGGGKTSLLRALSRDTTFQPSGSVQSHTDDIVKRTSDGVVWIDTPGLSDSEGRDTHHLAMIGQACKEIKTINTVALVLSGTEPRLSDYLANAVSLYTQMLGSGVLKHLIVVFTRWASDKHEVDRRAKKGITEAERTAAVHQFFRDRIGADDDIKIPCIFIDSDPDEDEDEEKRAMSTARSELIEIVGRLGPYPCAAARSDIQATLDAQKAAIDGLKATNEATRIAAAKKAEAERQRLLAEKAEAERQAKLARERELERQRQLEAQRQREAARQAELQRQREAEAQRQRYEEEARRQRAREEQARREKKQEALQALGALLSGRATLCGGVVYY